MLAPKQTLECRINHVIFHIFSGDLKIKRSLQPLVDYTFYLDFKNHAAAARIETRLRKLGAVSTNFWSRSFLLKILL